MYPDIRNSSDINSQEKADFLVKKGFENISLMQKTSLQIYKEINSVKFKSQLMNLKLNFCYNR